MKPWTDDQIKKALQHARTCHNAAENEVPDLEPALQADIMKLSRNVWGLAEELELSRDVLDAVAGLYKSHSSTFIIAITEEDNERDAVLREAFKRYRAKRAAFLTPRRPVIT